MLVRMDARRRITLPPKIGLKPGEVLELEVLDDGRIMLIPVVPIPRHQLWAWTTETKEAMSASLSDPRPSISVDSAMDAEVFAKRWARDD